MNFTGVSGQASIGIDQIRDSYIPLGTIRPTANIWNATYSYPIGSDLAGDLTTPISWFYNGTAPTIFQLISTALTGGTPTLTNNFDICNTFNIVQVSPAEQREITTGRIVKNTLNYPLDSLSFRNFDMVKAHRKLRENTNWLNLNNPEDSLYQQFYSSANISNIGVFGNVQDNVLAGANTSAENINTGIIANCQQEQNRKDVNIVYLQTWAAGISSFDSVQYTTLFNIANQTALDGGDAVYSARVMLGLFINEADANPNRIANYTTENETQESLVYPNPNDGNMYFDYSLMDDEQGELQIYDVMGKLIKIYELSAEENQLYINDAQLQNGVYLFKLVVNNQIVNSGKVIIIK